MVFPDASENFMQFFFPICSSRPLFQLHMAQPSTKW